MLGEQKEEKTLYLRVLSSSLYKDNTFSAEMQIVLTYRNILRNVKRLVLHTRASAMCYITRG